MNDLILGVEPPYFWISLGCMALGSFSIVWFVLVYFSSGPRFIVEFWKFSPQKFLCLPFAGFGLFFFPFWSYAPVVPSEFLGKTLEILSVLSFIFLLGGYFFIKDYFLPLWLVPRWVLQAVEAEIEWECGELAKFHDLSREEREALVRKAQRARGGRRLRKREVRRLLCTTPHVRDYDSPWGDYSPQK